ncbi:MAG: hypothetical protein M1814_003985 [Vezdaea aestivalis]|nr:MAG: hypothetical protein M1814_003985 [Vezdaea aestivalis]
MANHIQDHDSTLIGDNEDPHAAIHEPASAAAATSGGRRASASGGPRLRRVSSNGSTISLSNSMRHPSRSYFHRSGHGSNGPMDTNQHTSEEVRDQTAELGTIALASSVRSSSPGLRPNLSAIQSLDGSVAGTSDYGSIPIHPDDSIIPIEEVSEPVTPSPKNFPNEFPPTNVSALTELLRNSLPQENGSFEQNGLDGTATKTVPVAKPRPATTAAEIPYNTPQESTSLFHRSIDTEQYGAIDRLRSDLESQKTRRRPQSNARRKLQQLAEGTRSYIQILTSPKSWNKNAIRKQLSVGLLRCLSAVFIGLLLNILDALSYGTILFPRNDPFGNMEADGITLFYVSTVISQLVFSCGGSVFKGGVGSEMIEVVPFFHKMAFRIVNRVGVENPKSVIGTTITAYAISSILTGLVFFGMGKFHLGSLIGFFPRHILVGCIGGVGWFLVATGIEVSAQLLGSLEYNLPTFRHLVEPDVVFMWMIPLLLSIIVLIVKRRYPQNSFLVPGFILTILAAFYVFVISLDSLDVDTSRKDGWIFDKPPSGVSPFHVYSYYDFSLVDWGAILSTLDIMFALTFFGILHVPINVPALGMATKEDNVDVDRELIAHGVSNTLSGCAGSIQNYLVYTNSVLFINSGGNNRLAGLLLALATIIVACVGMDMIGFIPRMVVGTLIFLLGFDLMLEALYDTFGKMTRLEYATILAIMITMGTYDFVTGILVGIILACVNYVVQTSQKSAIRATYSGQVAHSTVRRHPDLSHFLREVGTQIELIKLSGFLFFGTIVDVENKIRALLEDTTFSERQIQFLILDFSHVNGIDFSGSEAFARINRILSTKRVRMVLSGLLEGSEVKNSLRNNGLWESDNPAELVDDLNSALEFCENEFIKIYNAREAALAKHHRPSSRQVQVTGQNARERSTSADTMFSSPRHRYLATIANTTLKNSTAASDSVSAWNLFQPPLPLLLETFKDVSSGQEDLWHRAAPYFSRKEYSQKTVLYKPGEMSELFIVLEEGLLLVEDDYQQGRHQERITPGTTCGELPFFSTGRRTATVTAETDVVAWELSRERLEALREEHIDVLCELQRIALVLTMERMDANMSYVLVRAG